MQLDKEKRPIEQSATLEVASATIKASAKIFDMFADQTYANKPVAIMRETVANGVDAHIAAGCPQRPVEVTLPTELDPMCVIKDFGTGMSHEFVMGPFMAYTDGSTKDSSNDQIGGFGIGSKSPLSYVDQFTLRVVHKGVLSIYTLFKGEDGIPMIGRQATKETNEPDGVEISFPVQADDVQTFRDAAQDALMYFDPMPKIHNGSINPPDYAYVGNKWALAKKAGPLGIIMGGVRYPVSFDSLDSSIRHDKQLAPLVNYGIDLTLPIGACGVAMSREALSYTAKTSAAIKAGLEGIHDDVVQTFSTIFDKCDTEWEAMATFHREIGGSSSWNRSARQQLMASNAKYKGQQLTTDFRLADNDLPKSKSWTIEPKSRSRGLNCPTPRWNDGLTDLYGITPGTTECIIFDDMEVSPKNKNVAKMRYYVDQNLTRDKTVIVIRPPHGTKLEAVRKLFRGCPDIVLTSTMAEPPKVRRATSGATRPAVRMFTYDGQSPSWGGVTTNINPGAGKRGIKELETAKQPASGIMVVMDNFNLPYKMHERMKTGLFKWDDLVFVNTGDAAKIKDDFKNFEDLWDKRLAAELKKHPDLAASAAIIKSEDFGSLFLRWRSLRRSLQLSDFSAAALSRPFGRIASLYEQYVAPFDNTQKALAEFVEAKLPPRVDPAKLRGAMQKQQPELVRIFNLVRIHSLEPVDVDIIKKFL